MIDLLPSGFTVQEAVTYTIKLLAGGVVTICLFDI
jgi:hypothetical protein